MERLSFGGGERYSDRNEIESASFELHEHRQPLLEQLRTEAINMLRSPEPMTRLIGEKILEKAEIKKRVEEMEAGAHDTSTYQELKHLGILVVRDVQARFSFEDPITGFRVNEGESYLELHLPPVPTELRSREAVEASFQLVARYIEEQGLEPKFVMGVTYERLAELAQRQFGFDVTYPDPKILPEDLLRGVVNVFSQFTQKGGEGADVGVPAIMHLDIEQFLRQYGV